MAIKKVWIEDGCTACGLCEGICPDVFEIEDFAGIKEGADYSHFEDEIKDAVDGCPVEVIKIIED